MKLAHQGCNWRPSGHIGQSWRRQAHSAASAAERYWAEALPRVRRGTQPRTTKQRPLCPPSLLFGALEIQHASIGPSWVAQEAVFAFCLRRVAGGRRPRAGCVFAAQVSQQQFRHEASHEGPFWDAPFQRRCPRHRVDDIHHELLCLPTAAAYPWASRWNQRCWQLTSRRRASRTRKRQPRCRSRWCPGRGSPGR